MFPSVLRQPPHLRNLYLHLQLNCRFSLGLGFVICPQSCKFMFLGPSLVTLDQLRSDENDHYLQSQGDAH